ncbi:MAG TPA: HAD hydrolase-like protein [Rudaea sp.]|nr:HAD hydrolase-like protein [Rudaea sp.]
MRSLHTRLALFDLDGTLIDSAPGIFASLDHAFAQIGASLPPRETLRGWIGPPFHQTFPSVLGDDPVRIQMAIEKYREHYTEGGWSGHTVYPGIAGTIATCAAQGIAMGVVTTKPLAQARLIIDNLTFGAHFVRIYGPDIKTAHSAKSEMIAQALDDFGVPSAHAVMIGDRHFDIEGARANNMRGIGVGWGFGSIDELRSAGAHAIAHTTNELLGMLMAP